MTSWIAGFMVLGLSFTAGWVVNVMTDALPAAQPLAGVWRRPWQALGRLARRAPGAADAYTWRVLLTWGAALLSGWLAYARFGLTLEALIVAIYGWFFLTVAVIDLEHRRVLNRMLLAALPFAAVAALLLQRPSLGSAAAGAALGFGVFLLAALARPGGMGMGDVKLAGVIGLITGLGGAALALTVGILAGGVAAAALLVGRRAGRRATMAYAPYLALGAWIALYFGADLWRMYLA